VNDPPQNGFHQATGFTEVIVSQPTQTLFLGLFGMSSEIVSARAVVGSGANNACVWTLARSGDDVSLSGSGSITVQKCDIFDNSSATDALTVTGSGSVTAQQIGIVGSYSNTGTGHITPNPPTTGIAPAADPLNLTAPTLATGTCSSNCNPSNSTSGSQTLSPGTYTSITVNSGTLTLLPGNYIITQNVSVNGGTLILGDGNYTIGGNFSANGSSAVTLGAGLYAVGGNLSLTGSGSLTGTGVSFYDQGSVTVTGSGNLDLTAPLSGPNSGVLFNQPLSDTHAMAITGSGGDTIQGIVYAPGAQLTLTGSGNLSTSLDIIVDSLQVSGSGSITDTNYSAVTNTNSLLAKLTMVE
jgi:hypothetical protein